MKSSQMLTKNTTELFSTVTDTAKNGLKKQKEEDLQTKFLQTQHLEKWLSQKFWN